VSANSRNSCIAGGDLGGESTVRRSNRALEGIKGHKTDIQQSRGSDYRPEVTVERSFAKGEVSFRVIVGSMVFLKVSLLW